MQRLIFKQMELFRFEQIYFSVFRYCKYHKVTWWERAHENIIGVSTFSYRQINKT